MLFLSLCCSLILKTNTSSPWHLMASILRVQHTRVCKFVGSSSFGHYKRDWKSWAPPKCRFFMWLVAQNRCWTADRLANRGLNHPATCPLCDQEPESINHLLASCVFKRVFWYKLLRKLGLHSLAPQSAAIFFQDWWEDSCCCYRNDQERSELPHLGAWMIWKHRNGVVFDGVSPNLTSK